MTLIEVIAALALLASVLVVVFSARGRVAQQQVRADQRFKAIAAADALLANWFRDPSTFPVSTSGPVTGHPDLLWRTQAIPNASAWALQSRVVRLDVFTNPRVGARSAPPVSVEVVLPGDWFAPQTDRERLVRQ